MFASLALLAAGTFTPAALEIEPASLEIEEDYWVYVAAESSDEVYVVRFDGRDAKVVERVQVGYMPTEIEGPHGLTVSPDGKHWFLSMAHGKPYGTLYKYETGTNALVAEVELGLFPATMAISPATELLYVVNFDLHGDMSPSSISIIDYEEMVEVARTTTGSMPHGSRVSPDGLHHYSCAMMSDQLYEIDASTFAVSRVLNLTAGDDVEWRGHDHTKEASEEDPDAPEPKPIKPTWVHPHPDRPAVFVALNAAGQVVEVDLESWEITRRFETAKGPYNVVVSPDGKSMVVSYKSAAAVGLWDLEQGKELARVPTSRKVTHGVVISPDSRYAFVTNEGIGAEKGTLDVFDLRTSRKVDTVEVGLQAGGIAFWKIERRD